MRKLLCLLFCAGALHGQGYLGTVSPQTVVNRNSSTPILNNVAGNGCSVTVPNIGNISQFVTYTTSGNISNLSVWMKGSVDNFATSFLISDIANNVAFGGLTAYVFSPYIQVCRKIVGTGRLTASFASSSVSATNNVGIFSVAGGNVSVLGINDSLDNGTPLDYKLDSTVTPPSQPPRGISGGTLWLSVQTSGGNTCTGAIVTVTAKNSAVFTRTLATRTWNTATTPTNFTIDVPTTAAVSAEVTIDANATCSGPILIGTVYSWTQPLYGGMVQGAIPSGSPNLANPVKIGCAFNTAQPTVASGSVVDLQCDANGSIIVVPSPTAPATHVIQQLSAASADASTAVSSTAYEASHVFKASAGNMTGFIVFNSNASARFALCFNATSLPANGTVTVTAPLSCPGATTCSYTAGVPPQFFSTGITCATSTTSPTLTIGAADMFFTGYIK